MAKDGLDYFPLDCQLDDKLKLIEAEYGITGFAVVVRLFQRIYGGKGYYCEWSNEVALLFAREVGLGGSVVSQILEASIRRGIFSKELFDKCEILTSHGIQKRYLEAVSRRQKVEIEKSYLLVDADNLSKNVYISSKNVYRNDKNVDISQQSKVKESKGKYIKDSRFAPPTADEVRAYCSERNNSVDAERFIDFYQSKGWKVGNQPMKDWKAAVRTWEKRDIQPVKSKPNKFNDYPQRTYTASDYQEIERKLINKGL